MIEEFASKVFATRNIAHREHWKTSSYAHHMALGDFYDAMIEGVDAVVEAYQGMFGKIDPFTVEDSKVDDIVGHLREESDWMETNRLNISGGSDAIAALVDNLVVVYLSAIYKLENLS